MPSQLKNLFGKIEPVTTAKLLHKSNGFVIPAFQRDFSWKKEHFIRFFEDVVSDLNHSADGTFMGSIICTQDIEALGHQVDRATDTPASVWQVVDGQQRLSFLTILATVIHEHINTLPVGEAWLGKAVKKMNSKIMNLIATPLNDSRDTLNPKIVREYYDYWSADAAGLSFKSPISRLLNKYISYAGVEKKSGAFKYDIPSTEHGIPEEHKSLIYHRSNTMRKLLEGACKGTEINMAIEPDEIFSNKSLLADLVDTASINLNKKISAQLSDQERSVLCALALGNYILENICFILIRMKTDLDKAFIVFDALNTTGRELNAYETFRPQVMRRDKEIDQGYLDEIDASLRAIKAGTRDQHVVDLIIAFASANAADYPGRKVHAQRKHLRTFYRDEEDKTAFLHLFVIASRMLSLNYQDQEIKSYIEGRGASLGKSEMLKSLAEKATFSLAYLKDARFTVPLGLFTRYLQHVHKEKLSPSSIEMFCRCILKTTSFFTLWRSSRESTAGIDNVFRSAIMEDFSRRGSKNSALFDALDIEKLESKYIGALKNLGNLSRASWKKETSETSMEKMKHVAKFLLLVGTHGTKCLIDDAGNPYLEIVNNGANIITSDGFRKSAVTSIEHILPQSKYKDKVYQQLWNLTLLPSGANSILQDKPWPLKKIYYRVLSSQRLEEKKRLIEQIEEMQGIPLSPKTREFLLEIRDDRFLHMTEFLGLIPNDDFNPNVGKPRIDMILGNCWNLLAAEWLNWEE